MTMSCELFNDRLMAYLEHETDDATRLAVERHAVTCADCGPLLADLRKLRIEAANLPELAPSGDLWRGIAERIEAPVVAIGTPRQAPLDRSVRRRAWMQRTWMQRTMIAASLMAAAGLGYFSAGTRGSGPGLPPSAEGSGDTALPVVVVAAPPETRPPTIVERPAAPESGDLAEPSPQLPPATPVSTPSEMPARPVEVQLALARVAADYDREIARLRALIEQRRDQLDPATVAIVERNLAVIDTAIAESRQAIVRDPASRFLIESLNQSLQTKVELMRTAALLPSRI